MVMFVAHFAVTAAASIASSHLVVGRNVLSNQPLNVVGIGDSIDC